MIQYDTTIRYHDTQHYDTWDPIPIFSLLHFASPHRFSPNVTHSFWQTIRIRESFVAGLVCQINVSATT
jgi:hypothetical protein